MNFQKLMETPEITNAINEFKNKIHAPSQTQTFSSKSQNPYITNQQGTSAIAPNVNQQLNYQQQSLNKMNDLANSANNQISSINMINPVALANALRVKGASDNFIPNILETGNAFMPWTQSKISSLYETDPYSEQSRMLSMQERGF